MSTNAWGAYPLLARYEMTKPMTTPAHDVRGPLHKWDGVEHTENCEHNARNLKMNYILQGHRDDD